MMTMINLFNNEKAPRKLGLYIHIPFCKTKCLYCDFCSFVSKDEAKREEYVSALLREIEARGTKECLVDTIYFGGGTPSLLSVEQIDRILSRIRENFVVCEDIEVTLECNPSTRKRDVEGAVPYGDCADSRVVEDVDPYGDDVCGTSKAPSPTGLRVHGVRPYDEGADLRVHGVRPYDEGAGLRVHGVPPYDEGADLRVVEDVDPYGVGEYFEELRRIGVNRLSIGIQSAIDGELKLIGRQHTFEEAKQTFFMARESGFDNISIDLMFGIPSQTIESLKISLSEFISLGAEHISIYSLQLEEGTPLYKMRDRYDLADDDSVADMYEAVVSSMKEAGYSHYEISNFAKVGKESRHNSKYWVLDEYLGLGLSAHSDFSGKRIENTKDLQKYLLGDWIENEVEIPITEREFEFIMLGLRTSRGISKSEFFSRFGIDFDEKYGEKIEKLEKLGYFCENGDFLALTEVGFEVSNCILAQILDFDY